MVRGQTGTANQYLETLPCRKGAFNQVIKAIVEKDNHPMEENPKEAGRLVVSFANPPEVPLDGTGFKEEAWDHKHKTPCAGPSQVSRPPVFYRGGWVTWEQPQTYFYTPV